MTQTVSVITITKDDPNGLERTIESVSALVGDFKLEHIIVDSDSGEYVRSILQAYKAEVDDKNGTKCLNTVKFVSEPDGGRYEAMNKGIELSSGDLIWLMHSNDTFAGDSVVSSALEAVSGKEMFWGYGFARVVDSYGECQGIFGYAPFKLRRFSLGGKAVPHQACFFSAEIAAEIGAYEPLHGLAADQKYILKCALLQPPTLVPEILCNFDNTGVGTSRRARHHYFDMRKARISTGVTVRNSSLVDLAITVLLTVYATTKRTIARQVRS